MADESERNANAGRPTTDTVLAELVVARLTAIGSRSKRHERRARSDARYVAGADESAPETERIRHGRARAVAGRKTPRRTDIRHHGTRCLDRRDGEKIRPAVRDYRCRLTVWMPTDKSSPTINGESLMLTYRTGAAGSPSAARLMGEHLLQQTLTPKWRRWRNIMSRASGRPRLRTRWPRATVGSRLNGRLPGGEALDEAVKTEASRLAESALASEGRRPIGMSWSCARLPPSWRRAWLTGRRGWRAPNG